MIAYCATSQVLVYWPPNPMHYGICANGLFWLGLLGRGAGLECGNWASRSWERSLRECSKPHNLSKLWHWKSHWKSRLMLKILGTKEMSNAENFQWDLNIFSVISVSLNNKGKYFSVIITMVSFVNIFQCDFQCHNFIVSGAELSIKAHLSPEYLHGWNKLCQHRSWNQYANSWAIRCFI